MPLRAFTAAGAAVLVLGVGACGGSDGPTTTAATATKGGGLPQGAERVDLDPADFTTRIDNPYWPMRPGTRWVYLERSVSGGAPQRIVVTVTHRTKKVAAGITGRVVHDVATEHGRTVEDTHDWYAQDSAGNLWYLGEATTEFEHGRPASTAGSWEAGVDGAQAGVALPAHPRVGMRYRQEYRKGKAEDQGLVLSVDEQAQTPAGHWRNVLMTRDTSPLEPKLVEHKFYARGVGPVLTVAVSGENSREELVKVTHR
jgi:hypothetical protein